MKRVLLVTAAVAASYAFAFRADFAGRSVFWWAFGVPHALLALFALDALRRDGTLNVRLTPRWGDLSLGALTAMVLLLVSWGARAVLAPTGTPRQAWLLALYLQLGDPEKLQHSALLTLALLAIAASEELVWRGFVLDRLRERLGTRLGWVAAAGLYALAAFPTLHTLRDPVAGYNPLLVFGAFGCGLVWTFLAARLGRLLPSAVSHLAFSYFSAVQFRWPS